jgi:hypothetical protein
VSESWEGVLVRLEAGVQVYRSARFAVGPYAALGAGLWLERELELGDATRSERVGRRLHGTAIAGVRLAWLP